MIYKLFRNDVIFSNIFKKYFLRLELREYKRTSYHSFDFYRENFAVKKVIDDGIFFWEDDYYYKFTKIEDFKLTHTNLRIEHIVVNLTGNTKYSLYYDIQILDKICFDNKFVKNKINKIKNGKIKENYTVYTSYTNAPSE